MKDGAGVRAVDGCARTGGGGALVIDADFFSFALHHIRLIMPLAVGFVLFSVV